MHRLWILSCLATFAAAAPAAASAVDFESVPGGVPSDGVRISDQYKAAYGVTFGLDSDLDGKLDPGSSCYLAGPNQATAYLSQFGWNIPADIAHNGQFSLTDDGAVGRSPIAIFVAYDSPSRFAYFEILDIDGAEGWTAEALDAAGNVVASQSFDASMWWMTGDGIATPVSFSMPTASIWAVRLRWSANPLFSGAGLAFDNFSRTSADPYNPDPDGDGIPAEEDECAETAPGSIVNGEGCSVDDLCSGVPKNHGDYVSCVVHMTNEFVKAGLMTRDTRTDTVTTAAQSNIGKK